MSRTTVRNLKRESDVRAMLKVGGTDGAGNRLTFFAARSQRTTQAGKKPWPAATTSTTSLLPFLPTTLPNTKMISSSPPAKSALRVLRASRDAPASSACVMTSSFAAIGYGHAPQTRPFDETTWSDLTGTREIAAYPKSKTLAERAAWDFIAKEAGSLELSVVNPVAIFGPVLGPDYSPSILIVQRLMDGALPGCPRISFGAVDVRDVVRDLHISAP